MNTGDTTPSDWFAKSDEHEKLARSILAHRDAPAWGVAFFSQQMAEVSLKGLLIFYNKLVVKTHDLVELKKLLISTEPTVDDLSEDMYILNRYYVENRYPGDYPEITWDEAEQALVSALRIKEFVLSKIKG